MTCDPIKGHSSLMGVATHRLRTTNLNNSNSGSPYKSEVCCQKIREPFLNLTLERKKKKLCRNN